MNLLKSQILLNQFKNQCYEIIDHTLNLNREQAINVIWIVSYPKSGNTWLRKIITALYDYDDDNQFVPGIHTFKPETAFHTAKEVYLGDDKVRFIKTHHITFPKHLLPIKFATRTVNYGFIYIYRHPLDVFLSALNHLYIEGKTSSFFNKSLNSVDELKQSGEIDLYMQKYINNFAIGNNAFTKMCGGTWLDHVNKWFDCHRKNSSNLSALIKYEDMIDDTFSTLKPVAELLGKSDSNLHNAIEIASKRTKKDGNFFWKQTYGNYQDYLQEKDIKSFTTKYKNVLEQLGY